LLERARDGDDEAAGLALAVLRRTPGGSVPSAWAAAAEAAVHVEAVEVKRDDGLEKTARAAVDAALAAFGWNAGSDEGVDEGRLGTDAHGLMIATLARASLTFDAPAYREAAAPAGGVGSFVCGNGIAALNLIDLSRLCGGRRYRDRAEGVLRAFAAEIAPAPLEHLTLLRAAQRFERTSSSV